MPGRRGRKPSAKANSHAAEPADADGDCDGRKISAQEEADLSSALIAKLLAEDCGGGDAYGAYYDDYSNGGGNGAFADGYDDARSATEADDDWDPTRKRQRAPRPGRGRKAAAVAVGGSGSGTAHSSGSASDGSCSGDDASSRPKKPRKAPAKKERPPPSPVAPGQFRSGAYTDDEEIKFGEGLELFGRSWGEISAHVATRDPKSIRSHAQKFFIKLFRDGLPLPAKVRESGDGYTLSGRPLDPNSAAARPYLQHVMQLDAVEGGREKKGEEKRQEQEAEPEPEPEAGNMSKQKHVPEQPTVLPDQQPAPDQAPDQALDQSPEQSQPSRTHYALSRPQRSQPRTVAIHYDDPHQMVRCTPFVGQPLSGVAGSQPFRLVVHTNALVQMDFHAHLMLSEVIGLLGGLWDADSRVLTVARAFVCDALESADAHTNVEMDPGSELVVRQQIADAGLRVVGWYHSHPTFRPDPSIIDIENQTAYQKLFRDDASAEEPFVGAIVAPYDPELPGPLSALNWFCVARSAVDRGHPKRLAVEAVPDHALPPADQLALLLLLDAAHTLKHRAALEEAWRPSSTELRALKMAASLALRMPWLARAETETEAVAETDAARASADAGANAADAGADAGAAATVSSACLAAGRRAARDPFLAALCSRFSVGVFRPGADVAVLDSVYAAYFARWAAQ
ncbi:hypothetical protein FB645_005268 [Coemansia sp. IMI 203386]|nr:hypothetical protein FB645_005268 [Coemansia sp. IMI 203386]